MGILFLISLSSKNDGIVVLGATNRPFDLDDAILRRMPRRILVDLPDEEARLKVLKVQLTDETLGDTIDLKDLSQRTKNYSGSDLRNVCVAAALARVKESIVQERNTSMSDSQLKKKLNTIDDWGSYLKSAPVDQKEVVLSPLQKSHFEIGLQECPPSLGEETQSLIELRKWDTLYGDGASRNKGKPTGIGFEVQAQSNNK
jgi:SpoVK/Ycf46/Vps4 family AAA+-type ATPase